MNSEHLTSVRAGRRGPGIQRGRRNTRVLFTGASLPVPTTVDHTGINLRLDTLLRCLAKRYVYIIFVALSKKKKKIYMMKLSPLFYACIEYFYIYTWTVWCTHLLYEVYIKIFQLTWTCFSTMNNGRRAQPLITNTQLIQVLHCESMVYMFTLGTNTHTGFI